MKNVLDLGKIDSSLESFNGAAPFDHLVIDDFFVDDIPMMLESEFLAYDDDDWYVYKNELEDKKACNNWNCFPPLTYKIFQLLTSDTFTSYLSQKLGLELQNDPGLHGGGWHIHGDGGCLNPHLDYSIHPKLGLQRKLNLIVYLSSDLSEDCGGHLGLWEHDVPTSQPANLGKEIQPLFNRAVLFDTTQNSWHGISRTLKVGPKVFRKSLAVYYLMNPSEDADPRQKALYAPTEEQKNIPSVLELIHDRADLSTAAKVYRSKK